MNGYVEVSENKQYWVSFDMDRFNGDINYVMGYVFINYQPNERRWS